MAKEKALRHNMYHSLDLFVNSKPQGQVLQHVRALSIYGPEPSSIFEKPKAQPTAQAVAGRQVESNENAQPDGNTEHQNGTAESTSASTEEQGINTNGDDEGQSNEVAGGES